MTLSVFDAVSRLVLAEAPAAEVSFDLLTMWRSMGLFAKLIASALGVMGVYSLGVVAERLVFYARARRASQTFARQLTELLPQGRLGEAAELSKKLAHGHLPRVLGLAIAEYHGVEGLNPGKAANEEVLAAVSRALERGSLYTANDFRRGLGGLATVGSTAPFVGLLGTVAGIITAFQAMAATGSGGLGSVSAGIAEALVTTAFGLLVAIPAVMMFNHLTARVDEMQFEVATSAHELVDFFAKRGRVRAGSQEPQPSVGTSAAEPVIA